MRTATGLLVLAALLLPLLVTAASAFPSSCCGDCPTDAPAAPTSPCDGPCGDELLLVCCGHAAEPARHVDLVPRIGKSVHVTPRADVSTVAGPTPSAAGRSPDVAWVQAPARLSVVLRL